MANHVLSSQVLAPLPARREMGITIGGLNVSAAGDTAIVGVNITTITAVNVWATIVGVA